MINHEWSWALTAVRLGLSLLLGGSIGIEREIHGRNAGLRTHMLVALGSALFTILSSVLPGLLGDPTRSDSTRIAAQVLTGVGFLGAGTIMQARRSVHGLTTAASIWLVAAIGMAAGGGFYRGAVLATGLGVGVLVLLWRMERTMLRRKGTRLTLLAEIMGETTSTWLEPVTRQLEVKPMSWRADARADRLRIKVAGRLTEKDQDLLLHAFEERGKVTSLRIERS
jgi:uncharacterized membrane protein YhiD involved in acid resistance